MSIPATADLIHADSAWADHERPPTLTTAPVVSPSPTEVAVPARVADLEQRDGQPIGELTIDLSDALSDSMTERFQALTLGGGFPTPADIAAMATVINEQADRRQAAGRHRPSSHRPAPPQERDLATQLTDLSRLHLAGALSDREFAMAKAQLLEP